MDLQRLLLLQGREAGMCEEFRDELREGEKTTAELCAMYHRGLDFCIEHNYPSMDIVLDYFDQDEIMRYGIYSRSGVSEGQSNVVALGNSCVDVYVPANGVCDLTLQHGSSAVLHLGEQSMCYVSMHGTSSVEVAEKRQSARLCASVFTDKCTVNDRNDFDKITNKF